MRQLRASLWYYRAVAPACMLVTAVCVYTVFRYDSAPIGTLLFLKIMTTGLFSFITTYTKKKELFFYYNIGLDKYKLFAVAFVVDLLIFILVLTLIKSIR